MFMTITISVVVIAVILVIFLVAAILLFFQIRGLVQKGEAIMEIVRTYIPPATQDVMMISREVSGILEVIHRQVSQVEESISLIRKGAERLRQFEEDILTEVERPVANVMGLIRGVNRGLEVFLEGMGLRR